MSCQLYALTFPVAGLRHKIFVRSFRHLPSNVWVKRFWLGRLVAAAKFMRHIVWGFCWTDHRESDNEAWDGISWNAAIAAHKGVRVALKSDSEDVTRR